MRHVKAVGCRARRVTTARRAASAALASLFMTVPPKRRSRLNKPDVYPPISEEQAAAIGFVAVRWTDVEGSLRTVFRDLLGLNWIVSDAVSAEMPVLLLTNIIHSLVHLTGNPGWIAEWKAIEQRLSDLRPKRNDTVHAFWSLIGAEHVSFRVQSRRTLQVRMTKVAAHDLNELSDAILSLADDITNFASTVSSGQSGSRAQDLLSQDVPPGTNLTPASSTPIPKARGQARPPKLSAAQKRTAKDQPSKA